MAISTGLQEWFDIDAAEKFLVMSGDALTVPCGSLN